MKTETIQKLKNFRTKLTGLISVDDLVMVLHKTEDGQEYCILKIINRSFGEMGFITTQYESVKYGDVIEEVTDSLVKPTYHYQDPLIDNNSYRMNGVNGLPMSQILNMIGLSNLLFIHQSKLKDIEKKYNDLYKIKEDPQLKKA